MLIPLNNEPQSDAVERLELKICEYTGAKHCLAVSSATSALLMMLLDFKSMMPQAEILLPTYGFPAVYRACIMAGLEPVPVEMNYETMSMDMKDAENKITDKTLAIFNVESNAVLGPLDEIETFANRYGIFFIEDSAPALTQKYNGVHAGRFGNAGVYSLGGFKVLNSGEGGAIVTDDETAYRTMKTLRSTTDNSNVLKRSLNFNMSYHLAELLLSQFENIDDIAKDRERVHDLYKQNGLNIFEDAAVTNRYQFVIYQSPSANKISEALTKFKIGHRYKHYTVIDASPVGCKIKSETIELPLFYQMEESQIKTVCNLVRRTEHGVF